MRVAEKNNEHTESASTAVIYINNVRNGPPLTKLSGSAHEGDGLNIFDSALDSVVFQTYK